MEQLPIINSKEKFSGIVFDNHTINGVTIYGIAAYSDFGDWYQDMISRVIPELNLMEKFIEMRFDIYRFTNKLIKGELIKTDI